MTVLAFVHALRPTVLDFLTWWKNELEACLPVSVRRKLRARGRQLTIRPLRDGVELDVVERGQGRTLREDAPLHMIGDDGWAQIADLMGDRASRIRLPAQAIYCTQLVLPAAAGRDLTAALELRLPLIAPVLPSAVCWGYSVGIRAGETLMVTVVMARASEVAQLAEIFDVKGLRPPPVEAGGAWGTVTLRQGTVRNLSPERRQLHLALVAGFGLMATIPLTVWAGSSIATWYNGRTLEVLREEVAPLNAAGRQATIADARRRAMGPLARQMTVAPIIDDIAGALPETSFLESLTIGGPDDIGFMVAGRVDQDTGRTIQEASRALQLMDVQATDEAGGPVEFRARVR